MEGLASPFDESELRAVPHSALQIALGARRPQVEACAPQLPPAKIAILTMVWMMKASRKLQQADMLTSSLTGSLGNGRELISAQWNLLRDLTHSRGSGASPGTKRSGRGCEPWTFTIVFRPAFLAVARSPGEPAPGTERGSYGFAAPVGRHASTSCAQREGGRRFLVKSRLGGSCAHEYQN